MPTTRVEKTRGAMTDLMRLRKMSRRKKTLFPQSGRTHPRSPPATRPTRIQVVSDSRYQGFCGGRGSGALSVDGVDLGATGSMGSMPPPRGGGRILRREELCHAPWQRV